MGKILIRGNRGITFRKREHIRKETENIQKINSLLWVKFRENIEE